MLAPWINRQQQAAIDDLKEENWPLKGERGDHRLRFSDGERFRLATRAKAAGRDALIAANDAEFASEGGL